MGIVILPNRTQVVSGAVTVSTTTPATVQIEQPLDDDGNPYVNPNVPGADIATGDRQNQILAALQAAQPRTVSGSVSVSGTVPVTALSSALAPNAAQETAGQLQRVGDLLEMLVQETRVTNALIAQLGQPVQDGPDQLREDLNLAVQ